jgi:hypothetical protein
MRGRAIQGCKPATQMNQTSIKNTQKIHLFPEIAALARPKNTSIQFFT